MYIAVLSPTAPHPKYTLLLEYKPPVKHPNPHNMGLAEVSAVFQVGAVGEAGNHTPFPGVTYFLTPP